MKQYVDSHSLALTKAIILNMKFNKALTMKVMNISSNIYYRQVLLITC